MDSKNWVPSDSNLSADALEAIDVESEANEEAKLAEEERVVTEPTTGED